MLKNTSMQVSKSAQYSTNYVKIERAEAVVCDAGEVRQKQTIHGQTSEGLSDGKIN